MAAALAGEGAITAPAVRGLQPARPCRGFVASVVGVQPSVEDSDGTLPERPSGRFSICEPKRGLATTQQDMAVTLPASLAATVRANGSKASSQRWLGTRRSPAPPLALIRWEWILR